MRRALTRLLVPAFLLLALGLLPAQAEEGTFELEARVPASTLAFLSVEDVHTWSARIEATAIGKLANDPEMQAFLKPMTEQVMELVQGGMAQVPPIMIELLKQIGNLKGQLAVAFVDMDMTVGTPHLAMSLDFGGHVGEFVAFLDKMRTEMDPSGENVRRMERGGRTWWQVQADQLQIYATIVDTAFVAATDDTLLEKILAGPVANGLAADEDFQKVRGRVGGDDLGMFFYGNVDAALQKFGDQIPPQARTIADALGLDTVASVAYGMAFKGDGFRDTLMLHAPQADHGIVPLMKLPPLRAPKTLGMAPAGTLMWAEGSLPFDDLLARIRTLVGTIDPDATEQMDGGLAQANQMLGVDVEKDLLGGMSGPYGFYVALPTTGGLYPEVAVIFGVKDAASFEGMFDRLVQGIAGAVNEQGKVIASTRAMDYHGTTMHLFEMQKARGDDPVPFTPTWALIDDKLVVTLVPYAMKEIILRVQGITTQPGLATQEDFQALMAVKPADAAIVEYVDLKALLSLLYDTGVPLLQTIVKPNVLKDVPFEIDWALLPPASRVVPHFRSMAEFVTWNEDGLVVSIQGPMPFLPLYASLSMALPFMMFARASSEMPGEVIFEPVPGMGGDLPQPSIENEMDLELAMIQAEMLHEAVVFFTSEKDRAPTSLQELVDEGLMGSVPEDPWGGAYRLRTTGDTVVVESAGPDKSFGTDDDVRHKP